MKQKEVPKFVKVSLLVAVMEIGSVALMSLSDAMRVGTPSGDFISEFKVNLIEVRYVLLLSVPALGYVAVQLRAVLNRRKSD